MITIPHIYVVRAYSLKGKFYTQFLSCTTGTAFLVSPSNSLIQLVKYCIAWFDVCDSFSESKYSIHIAHIITLIIVWGHNCFQLQSLYHTALHKICWWMEYINECMWVVDLVHILKCCDIIFLAERTKSSVCAVAQYIKDRYQHTHIICARARAWNYRFRAMYCSTLQNSASTTLVVYVLTYCFTVLQDLEYWLREVVVDVE
jgi:hypothetical protein